MPSSPCFQFTKLQQDIVSILILICPDKQCFLWKMSFVRLLFHALQRNTELVTTTAPDTVAILLFVLSSTSYLQCGEGQIMAHSQWLTGVDQLQGPSAHTSELPLQADW